MKNLIKPLPANRTRARRIRTLIKEHLTPGATKLTIRAHYDTEFKDVALNAGWKVVKVNKAPTDTDRHYFVTDTIYLVWVGG